MNLILEEIIHLFKNKKNMWLGYIDISNLLERIPLDHSEKRKLVLKLLTDNPLFETDKISKITKFRLKPHIFKEKDLSIIETFYAINKTRIIIDDEEYKELRFIKLEDFENEIIANYRLIFGKDTVYYRIENEDGRISFCNGMIFNTKTKEVIFVIFELSIPNLYSYMVSRIGDFFKIMNKNKSTINLEDDFQCIGDNRNEVINNLEELGYNLVVIINKSTFGIEEERKKILTLIKQIIAAKNVSIIFKEFSVFINKNNNKIFSIRNSHYF